MGVAKTHFWVIVMVTLHVTHANINMLLCVWYDQVLLDSFEGSMRTLHDLAEKNQRRVDKLDHVCLKQEKEHAIRIGELDGLYSVSEDGWKDPGSNL